MGRIIIQGEDTLPFLEFAATNFIASRSFGKAYYTLLCNEEGRCLDDVLVYLLSEQEAFLVANGVNRDKVFHHLLHLGQNYRVTLSAAYLQEGILSLQGPASAKTVAALFPGYEALPRKGFARSTHPNFFVSRTGYTGEDGFEFFGTFEVLEEIWEKFFTYKSGNVAPCGLGARDILRLEMGYALYGHEISPMISPDESIAAWAIKWEKPTFCGKRELERIAKKSTRKAYALVGDDTAIAREGHLLMEGEKEVGVVTSGTFSPSLKKPIALGISSQPLEKAHILIRDKLHPFTVVKLPFIKRPL